MSGDDLCLLHNGIIENHEVLREELQGTGVSVTRDGDNITLNMPGNVTFATDRSDLNPAFFDVLRSVGKVVNEFDRTIVEVAGHTDSDGAAEYNEGLSARRAATVRDYLIASGVAEDRMTARGYGESQPIASNDSAEGKAQNRRVVLRITER